MVKPVSEFVYHRPNLLNPLVYGHHCLAKVLKRYSEINLIAWRDRLNELQEAGNVRDIKTWLVQFVSRIELGYNTVKISYTYPMTDLLNSRNTLLPRGGTNFIETANR